jgi:hypothetical protein
MFIKVTYLYDDGSVEPGLMNLNKVKEIKEIKVNGKPRIQFIYDEMDETDGSNYASCVAEPMEVIAGRLIAAGQYIKASV